MKIDNEVILGVLMRIDDVITVTIDYYLKNNEEITFSNSIFSKSNLTFYFLKNDKSNDLIKCEIPINIIGSNIWRLKLENYLNLIKSV